MSKWGQVLQNQATLITKLGWYKNVRQLLQSSVVQEVNERNGGGQQNLKSDFLIQP